MQQIEFFEEHLAPWAANAVAIGLTAAQVTTLGELTATARGSFTDAKGGAQHGPGRDADVL